MSQHVATRRNRLTRSAQRVAPNHVAMWNRELTLKCKLKCYVKPMKDLVKGITEPHEVKKNSFDLGGNRTPAKSDWLTFIT